MAFEELVIRNKIKSSKTLTPLRKETIENIHKQKASPTLCVVSNTHWDREHRHSFQETRFMLVEMLDKLINIMQNDEDYRYFTLDGQSVILEDYLEVRPEQKNSLMDLIQQDRILIGPWYTLPDMQAVNGECIVRSLLIGDKICREYGKKMNFGYSIFSFGQIAQLPQIYRGFGIKDMVAYKGFNPEIFKNSEFVWTSPDGSSVLASRLGNLFRVNFFFCFTVPVLLGGDARKPNWSVNFSDKTKLCHLIDKYFSSSYATELCQDIRVRKENISKAIKDTLKSVKETKAKDAFLAFDGIDFSFPIPQMSKAIKLANKMFDDIHDYCCKVDPSLH